MTDFRALTAFLDEFFQAARFSGEKNGPIVPTTRPLARIGLALDPWPGLASWAADAHLDAVLLHRTTHLEPGALPSDVGVLSYHLPFDEKLTLGWNLRLADVMGLSGPEVIGWKQGRPLGMIGAVSSRNVADFYHIVTAIFGGHEEARTCERNEVTRVAVVGAMTEALVHEASERAVDVYITGQFRQPGRVAMLDTGIGVIAVGHKRSEEWGLRALAHVLRERWAKWDVILPPRPGQT